MAWKHVSETRRPEDRHDSCRILQHDCISLTESAHALRKVRYGQDTGLDLGRDKSARVEFAAAPRCALGMGPDYDAHCTSGAQAGGNAGRARPDRLMGFARARGFARAHGLETAS
jgi:hypothetical protein